MRKRPKITEKKYNQWASGLKKWISESVSPFADDTPAKRAQRKRKAKNNLLFFCKCYLPHYFNSPFGEFHNEWADFTKIKDEAAFIAAPREHGKSTFFTFAAPIHAIVFELKHFIPIISDTNDQAQGFTLPIRSELEENPRIIHDFGKLRGDIWKTHDFTTSTGIRVLARGKGEKIRGKKNRQYRPDLVIVDDFENDENVENPRQVKKGLNWLKKAVIGSMGKKFAFIMIGNIFHPKSVLAQFMAETDENNQPLYKSKIYDCWVDYGKITQRPLWPGNWSIARLLKKTKQMGMIAFNAEMRNLADDGSSPFNAKDFKFYRREGLPPDLAIASFVDPSPTHKNNNDYKAVVTVGINKINMEMVCLHAWIRTAGIPEMFDEAYRQHEEYGGMVGIEENMLHDFLHESIQNYAKEKGAWLPWQPVDHRTNKQGRIISTLQYLIQYGKLRFCRHHSDQDLLVEQLIYILNKNVNDDGPDALEGAVRLLQEQGINNCEYSSLRKRRFKKKRGCF